MTVPNSPTNGATEPTVARKDRPPEILLLTRVHGALQRHGDPLVQIDAVGQAAFVMRSGTQTALGDVAIVIALASGARRHP